MSGLRLSLSLCLALLLIQFPAAAADIPCQGKVYGKGKKAICLPLGALSFADRLVSFDPGEQKAEAPFDQGDTALGEPNYKNTRSPDFVSLGCHGELVVQFTDNVLVDVDGMDLYIFEVGPFVEKTRVWISSNGSDWIDIGEIEGARADIDIAPFVSPGEKFDRVKLVNAGKSCGGRHAGADIDAIAAVGAEIRLSLDAALLFDVGKAELKPEATAEINKLAAQLVRYGQQARLTLEGHTDSTGGDADNQRLSEARAQSVWRQLKPLLQLPADRVQIRGYGEARPVADNATEEGRAQNRRVDILIVPAP